MKTRNRFSKVFAAAALLTLALVAVTTAFVRAAPQEAKALAAPSQGGAALGTGVFTLLPGQTVRVAAVNVGGKAIPLQLYIIPVTEQGKVGVPILCNLMPAPGDAAFETFTNTNPTRMLMYAQVRVREDPNDIKELVPSLEVFDEQNTGIPGPHFLLSGDDFVGIRPIWVP
jgi:hypothetical protein